MNKLLLIASILALLKATETVMVNSNIDTPIFFSDSLSLADIIRPSVLTHGKITQLTVYFYVVHTAPSEVTVTLVSHRVGDADTSCELTSSGFTSNAALAQKFNDIDQAPADTVASSGTCLSSFNGLIPDKYELKMVDGTGGDDGHLYNWGVELTIEPLCGDGHTTQSEICDDGNTDAGDGCSATCTIETKYVCDQRSPSNCMMCHDGCIECYSPNMCTVCDGDHELEKSGRCRDKKDFLLPSLVEGGIAILVVVFLIVMFSLYSHAHHSQIEKREVLKEQQFDEEN